ncbi:phytoene desaturase family protein [Gottfriedia solisilvae]|uniref:Dehydrogenase n=1 Tax=Gottfriedia solisilvae TaxID=1516104 RepID=A0A8J3AM09_9BACI|nr:FAD-dependent oxidoreductase [Gottfriedia solisilvae]GGI16285.1 dehydrogenase [Gottfriedia solisilvae]
MYSTEDITGVKWDVVILGGGIAGLTASILLAQEGKKVLVLEKGGNLGGRGISNNLGKAHVNLGPHALFTDTLEVFNEVGVNITGKSPKLSGGAFVFGKDNEKMNVVDIVNLFLGSHLKWKEKMEFIRFYRHIRKMELDPLNGISLKQYLSTALSSNKVKDLIYTFVRLSTYSNNPELISARVAISQLRGTSVLYLNEGWQTIVNNLISRAKEVGVTIQKKAVASKISGEYPELTISLKDGQMMKSRSIVSTINPHDLMKLVGEKASESFRKKVDQMIPVRAACLDLVMSGLPNPKTNLALGVENPWYFSNHSTVAKLSDEPGQIVVHVMKYLDSMIETEAQNDEYELECFLDVIQPGWRNYIVSRRFLPKIVVSNAIKKPRENIVEADEIGIEGLYIAGDWVGDKEILLSASLSSVKNATKLLEKKLAFQHL